MAVASGTTFTFAVHARRADVEPRLVDLATDWLKGGLADLGVGAKTAAGYGYFRVGGAKPLPAVRRHRLDFHLVTHAFLGEANGHARRLRLPSLKAHLRWWWRAARTHLTTSELAAGESEVFGSQHTGVRARLVPAGDDLRLLRRGADMGRGGSPWGYLGYGPIRYDMNSGANLTTVDALEEDQPLAATLVARSDDVAAQVLQAAWLLGALGGFGARHRRGWGSVQLTTDVPGLPRLTACRTRDEYCRALLEGLGTIAPPVQRPPAADCRWAGLSREFRLVLSPVAFPSAGDALGNIGSRFMWFRTRDRRRADNGPGPDYHTSRDLLTAPTAPPTARLPERAGFGMPYQQQYRSLDRRTAVYTPFVVDAGQEVKLRRASPLLIKVGRLATGGYFWQVAFLPAQFLPAAARVAAEEPQPRPSPPRPLTQHPLDPPGVFGVHRPGRTPDDTLVTEFLDGSGSGSGSGSGRTPDDTLVTEFLDWLSRQLTAERTDRPPTRPNPPPAPPPRPAGPQKGDEVGGTLSAQKTNKKAWKGELGDGLPWPIVNPEAVPADARPGTPATFRIEEVTTDRKVKLRFLPPPANP